MFKGIIKFFDKIEDKVRIKLSHRSILYAFIGGTGTVIFWRGVWHSADILMEKGGFLSWFFYEPITVLWSSIILLITGLFVSIFIGERIIISGLKKEKKVTDKTEIEVDKEENEIRNMRIKINQIAKDIEEIRKIIK
ncbi:MAG: hypothetical protein V1910_02635 [bacterium]